MTTTSTLDEQTDAVQDKPGAQLAAQRVLRDYSQAYVAGKLHLRVRIIELLEADDYDNMPEPVFIKGYLRAYAKLLGVPADPLLSTFNLIHSDDKKIDRALWQSRRQSHRSEYATRWITILLSLGVLVAVGMWWESTKDNARLLPTKLNHGKVAEQSMHQNNVRLTDLSKMRSLLSSVGQDTASGEAE
ncbi:MAG: helix-turn-helix domain-containing protein [Gammaproteobacteria bacterium]|nr:helix-turn-helix domain-containing protein [Gammaproteobacteria bacterium]